MSSAEVNPETTISRIGQRLVLRANQPIDPVQSGNWTISPTTRAEVSSEGNTITVRFAQQLNYNTEYTITVETRGAHTAASGQLRYSFTTPDVELFSLVRDERVNDGVKVPDRILHHTLSGSHQNEIVYEAPRIQEYVAVSDFLAVITLDESNSPALVLSSLTEPLKIPIYTPPARTARELRASDSAELFGYILDGHGEGDEFGSSSTLFIHDLADSSGVPREITGVNGEPLQVLDWTFVPGTSSLVAQGQDQQLYLIDPLSNEPPKPLGQHAELRGFIPGTAQLVVADPLSGSLLDLAAGTSTALSLGEATIDPSLYPDKLLLLTSDSYFQQFNQVDYTTSTMTSALFFTDQTGTHEVFRPASASARIRNYCLSPNNQYLAVEVVSGDSEPGNDQFAPGGSSITSYFVDVESGGASRGVNGFMPNWCD